MTVSRKQKQEEALLRLRLIARDLGMKKTVVTQYAENGNVMLSDSGALIPVNDVPELAEAIHFVEAKLNVIVYHAVSAPTTKTGYSLLYVSNEESRWNSERLKLSPYTDPFDLKRVFVDTITVILHKNTPFIPKVVSFIADKGVLRVLG